MQVALARHPAHSGTSSVARPEENLVAGALDILPDAMTALNTIAGAA